MKIAFWSNVHGQTGTTSNMVAIAAAVSMSYRYKCLVTQAHFNMNSLEASLIGSRENSRDIFMDAGIDTLLRSIKLAPLEKSTFDNNTISLLQRKLYLLPGTTSENQKIYYKDMAKVFGRILSEAEKHYDIVFTDLNSGSDEISDMVLRQADITVINLCQNKSMLESYFSSAKYHDQFHNQKVFYLIGNYDRASVYNIHNLKLLYKPLSARSSDIIPYNTEFRDALSDGRAVKFLRRNLDTSGTGADSYFKSCILRASGKLLTLAGEKKGGMNIWQKIS